MEYPPKLLCNVLKINLNFHTNTIDSYGDYLFAIIMDIYHEFSEYRC